MKEIEKEERVQKKKSIIIKHIIPVRQKLF